MDISENIAKINDKIKSASDKAGRSLEEIKLIAVSKKKSTDLIAAAHHCGLKFANSSIFFLGAYN